MSSAMVESLVLDAGKSPELVAALSLVMEADVNGEPKFTPRDCRELTKVITCRTYGKPMLELCHLVRIADAWAQGAGYELFFWGGGPARANVFRAQAMTAGETFGGDTPGFTVTETGVEARYPDGQFTVTFGRMPFLSALLYFLGEALGYDFVDQSLRPLLEPDAMAETVSNQANALSASLYDYLKDHLPAVQTQRKFRRLIGFMEDQKGADFTLDDIDDESIITFWEGVSGDREDDGADFKTYLAAFKAFIRLSQVLEHARDLRALDQADSIGSNWEAGEVDPDRLSELLEEVDEELNPLLALQEGPPEQIKFLNKKEFEALETLFESGRTGLGLPLSVMRCGTFGRGQGRITQALRRKAARKELGQLIRDCAALTYIEMGDELIGLTERLERTLLASLHALLQQRDPEALSLMLVLAPEADLSPMKELIREMTEDDDGGNVVAFPNGEVADAVIDAAGDAARVGEDVASLTARAAEAFNSLSRKGFGRNEAQDPDFRDGFSEGARLLVQVFRHVKGFTYRSETIDLPAGGWVPQFDADRPRFTRQFQVLYGETP